MAIALGWGASQTSDPPRTIGPYGVAMALPDLKVKPRTAGIAVQMVVRADTGTFRCDREAEVLLVFSGTAEFWRQHYRRMPRWTRFAIAIVNFGVGIPKVRFPNNPSEIEYPAIPSPFEKRVPVAPARNLEIQSIGRVDITHHPNAGMQIVGRVKDWGKTWAPIVVSFRAAWTEDRALGSCYVRLPPLTAEVAGAHGVADLAFGGDDLLTPSYSGQMTATIGYTALATDGRIDRDLSDPSPSGRGDETIWTCGYHGKRTPISLIGPGGLAADSKAAWESKSAPSCGAVAVVETWAAQPLRAVLLIGVGTLLSAVVQAAFALTERRGRRQGR